MGAVNLRETQLAKLKGQVNEISLVTDDGDDTSLSLILSDMVKFDKLLYELHVNVKRHQEPMQSGLNPRLKDLRNCTRNWTGKYWQIRVPRLRNAIKR